MTTAKRTAAATPAATVTAGFATTTSSIHLQHQHHCLRLRCRHYHHHARRYHAHTYCSHLHTRTLSAASESVGSTAGKTLLEIGCGVGNAVFPMLHDNPSLVVWCCDLSPRAIDFVRGHTDFNPDRCHPFQCDITTDDLGGKIRDVTPESRHPELLAGEWG
jgi:SAM-dependent methyltransferase